MNRTLVIGDIHGGLRALHQIMERAKVSITDTLLFLGDYVVGWSQSPQVIDYLTDITGTPSHYYNYLPFGEEMVAQNNSSYNNVYRFSAKELDEDTGLSYFGARYYDPKFSIWLSVDPLAETMPFASPYNYCLQNPINLVDPDGKKPTDWYLNLFTGKITWKDGQGSRFMYKDLGYSWGSTDINGNRFLMDGETKQISYNGTVLQDFNKNKSAFDITDGFTIWGKERSGDTSGLKGTTTDSFESDDVPTLGNGDETFGSIFSKAETALKKLIKFFNITDGTLDTFDRGQGAGQQILNATKKANVEVEKPKKTEQTEFIYTNYDPNNPNNNVQVRREDYEAQQKKKNERQ